MEKNFVRGAVKDAEEAITTCSLGYNRIMIKDCKGIYYEPDGTDPGRGNVGAS